MLDDSCHIKLIDFSTAKILGKVFDKSAGIFIDSVKWNIISIIDIETKYTNYKNYADSIINHFISRRNTLKNSLLRK